MLSSMPNAWQLCMLTQVMDGWDEKQMPGILIYPLRRATIRLEKKTTKLFQTFKQMRSLTMLFHWTATPNLSHTCRGRWRKTLNGNQVWSLHPSCNSSRVGDYGSQLDHTRLCYPKAYWHIWSDKRAHDKYPLWVVALSYLSTLKMEIKTINSSK